MLGTVAWISIGLAFLCAAWIVADETRHPQKMAMMNIVWPITALYFSVFAVWAYYAVRKGKNESASMDSQSQDSPPTLSQTAVGTSHCGAGCMIADVGAEFAIAAAGLTLMGSVLWAEFAIDLGLAWALGIVFQYFAIKPMRKLSPAKAIIAAIKADTLSILAFQIGMYAWMAFVFFRLFPHPHLTPFQPAYWLMMQIGMIAGYCTSLPMNWSLIRAGLKERM